MNSALHKRPSPDVAGVSIARHAVLWLWLLLLGAGAGAATLPPGFTEEVVAGPWTEAVGLAFEPEQQTPGGRMYVWERGGRVWLVENDVKLSPPLLDISEEVGAWRDFGLLGFALHPNFRQNGYIYLSYVVDHHHLTKFGSTNYHADTNEYFTATIGRITRYTAQATNDFRTVDPASRKVLVGESITNGFPITYQSHGVGSLAFGADGTLLAAAGDGGTQKSYDYGSVSSSYYTQALSDGILRPKENVGAFRAQMVDSLSGKIIRIDPDTGDGVPGNPFYDPAAPRAPRSRVWALGLRNPYRLAFRPGTGSHVREDANPGVFYLGDVGWNTNEEINVVTGPGQNFGWPLYEGFNVLPNYLNRNTNNYDAPNPLYGTNGCTRPYFYFRDLLVQDTLLPPSWPNPCRTNEQVPSNIPHFVHRRPALEWNHSGRPARTGTYTTNGNAAVANVGDPGSPVSGEQFSGTSSIGGTWYTGDDFPAQYRNTYFNGDFEGGWIRNFQFDSSNRPVAVRGFLTNGGGIVCIATHPVDGGLYYISWSNDVKRIRYVGTGNQPPQAAATASPTYGPSPLAVAFDGRASIDPEGFALRYRWDFGDGSLISTQANPAHTFIVTSGVPTRFSVTLTVTDNSNAMAQATIPIFVNNTPPAVRITSPTNGMRYPLNEETLYELTALVSDAEHSSNQLTCEWQTILHHNAHIHAEPADTNCTTSTLISPLGCDGETYYYGIVLKVTDAAGLATTEEVRVYPDCPDERGILRYLGREGGGAIRWQLAGAPTRSYVVEGSTNLIHWNAVTNVQPSAGSVEFQDPSTNVFPFRFYRTSILP